MLLKAQPVSFYDFSIKYVVEYRKLTGRLFGYNKWESVKEVICLLERLNIQYLVFRRRLLFYKRIELCNNTVEMEVFRNFLNGSEAQMVHAKCKTNQF